MSEYSIIWPGNSVGDAVNAPLRPDEIAKAFYYFFEFCPRPGLGYKTGDGAYEAFPDKINISGKDIYLTGAVVAGYLNGLEVTNPSGVNIRINTGGAIVDGRVYIADSAPLTQAIAAPGAGTNYYIFGIRSTNAGQTVEAFYSGPETDIASLTQSTVIGGVYEMVLAIVAITNASVITITDCRRLIAPNGYQNMMVASRQGVSSSDWSLSGNVNYEPDDDIASVVIASKTPYAFNALDESPIVLASAVGSDAELAAGVVKSSIFEGVIVDNYSGAFSSADTYFNAFIIGSDDPDRVLRLAAYAGLLFFSEETY